MTTYRLDKTYFKSQTFQEADYQKSYWTRQEVDERLRAAWYLISCVYRFNLDNPPRLDKRIFSMRKHKA